MRITMRPCLWVLAAVLASGPSLADTVTLSTFLDPAKTSGRDLALKQIVEAFEAANPDTRVHVESHVFSELGPKFLMGLASGTAADVTFIGMENLGSLVQSGAAIDLQNAFISGWPEGDGDFYMRASWDAALSNGARYAVPLFPGTTTLYYRKDLFAEAGIDPASLKTWEDLTAAAKKMTRDTNGDGLPDIWGFATPLSAERTGGTNAIVPMILGSGQESVWPDCLPMYDTEAGRRAIQRHADWIKTDQIMSGDMLAANSDDVMEQFMAGRSAMAVGAFARFEATARNATWNGQSNLGILPWPTEDGATAGPQIISGWFVAGNAGSPRAEASARFIEFLISPQAVKIWSATGGQVPTRASVLADPLFQDSKFDYMRDMQKAWGNWSVVLPTACNPTRYDADLNTAVQRVVVGGSDPSSALREAEASFLQRQQ